LAIVAELRRKGIRLQKVRLILNHLRRNLGTVRIRRRRDDGCIWRGDFVHRRKQMARLRHPSEESKIVAVQHNGGKPSSKSLNIVYREHAHRLHTTKLRYLGCQG
jgi:hypothetical protein